MFTRFLDGLSSAREATRSAGQLSSDGVDVYARREGHAHVHEVLDTAYDLGRRLVRKRAELSLEKRADGRVQAPRADVLRVLVNLIRNAADAVGGEIGGMVMVEAWQSPEFVYLSVADNGPGIPEADIDRVFDLFYTTKGHGTGVGLFVCNMLVRGWGGELRVESRRGHGARFTASIPRASPIQAD
jgi:signal transduction histidine kinase